MCELTCEAAGIDRRLENMVEWRKHYRLAAALARTLAQCYEGTPRQRQINISIYWSRKARAMTREINVYLKEPN